MSRHCLFLCFSASFVAVTVSDEAIVGGKHSKYNQFPYQVSLKYCNDQSYCGGGIIDHEFILTAAHCVVTRKGRILDNHMYIHAGSNNLTKTNEPAVIIGVKKIFVPKYFKDSARRALAPCDIEGDIAVVKLNQSLKQKLNSQHLKMLRLPSNNHETYAGKIATIAGFGWDWINSVTKKGLKSDELLLYAEAEVLHENQCHQKLLKLKLSNKRFCAKVILNECESRGVCRGDSGGPLVHNGTVIGILSYGPTNCKENDKPGIYTSASQYLKFIENVVKDIITNDTLVLKINKT